MRGAQGDYISSRASRTVDLHMIAICVLFVFALCSTSYNAAAQNPNLLEQMEGEFNDLSNNAISWNVYSESNQDTLAQYNIGLRSEWAGWTLETEPGYIEIYDASLPDVIPLCITQDWLNQFYVIVHAYGGYDFDWGTLKLEQEKTGKCYILDVVIIDQWTGDCCVDYYYRFELKLRQDPICFDANNFPTITGDFTEYHDPAYEDLNKEVTACFMSQWSGCILDEQEFLIS
ncbi:MAG: hypothetical protein ACFFEX_18565 [Candidatus Thorarchaeota archaeon]